METKLIEGLSDNTWTPNPVSGDVDSGLETVWEARWEWQDAPEGRAAVGTDTYEQRWDDICTAMAWIKEALE